MDWILWDENIYLPLPPTFFTSIFVPFLNQSYGLIPILFPKKKAKEDRWRNIPADCRIDWKRHREHFLWDLGNDIATYFNTFDTTYIERTRYDFQVKLYNTHFLQLIRLSGTDATGSTQSLTFAPAHEVKLGPLFCLEGAEYRLFLRSSPPTDLAAVLLNLISLPTTPNLGSISTIFIAEVISTSLAFLVSIRCKLTVFRNKDFLPCAPKPWRSICTTFSTIDTSRILQRLP